MGFFIQSVNDENIQHQSKPLPLLIEEKVIPGVALQSAPFFWVL